MHVRARRVTAIAAALCVGVSLAACGGGDDSAEGQSTIEWWVPDWDEEAAAELLDEFAETHPDIKVETVQTTWETMGNQIRVALDSGDTPDLITELTSRIPVYASKGQLLDVTDWYDDNMPRDDFYEAAVSTASFDDKVYGVPFRWDAGSMVYNADLFAEAGIEEPPATWAELKDAAKALQAIGVYAYGWPFGEPNNARVRWLNEYYTQGGEFTEEEDGSVSIDAEASEAALEVLAEGFDEGYVTPSSLEASNTDLQNLLINEQIAFYFEGAYAVKPIEEAGINIGTAVWPGPDGPGTVSADGFSLIVPEGTEHPDEVKELTQFLAQPESQTLMTETFPARISAADAERFQDPLFEPFIKQHGEYAMSRPAYAGWEDLVPTIHSALQSIALGDQTPAEANESILQHAEQILRVH